MPRSSPTNEQILHSLRYSEEWHHRRCREYFFADRLLTLTLIPFLPVPQVELEHIQDSCNKSTAIYFVTPHFEPHTRNYNRDAGDRFDIIYSTYEQWFRGHHVDIDFGKFVAKLISIKIPSDEQRPTVEDMMNIHEAWCEHVEITLPLCSKNKDFAGTEIEDHSYKQNHGPVGINEEQYMHYKLQPLFRALIIIIDNYASETGAEKVVHLIRTNITSKLSAPVTFESITPKFEQDSFFGHGNDKVVTTTLSAAIDFVMALESREQTAFPEKHRDPSIVDRRMGDSRSHMEIVKSRGYTGPEIRGPSTG